MASLSDPWGFNSHEDEKRGERLSKEPSFDDVPPGYGAGREWEK